MEDRRESRRQRLLEALEQAAGNRSRAGEILGVGRATVYRWLREFGLDENTLRVVGGRWEVLGVLGRGGHGTVYRVRDSEGAVSGERALKLLVGAHRDRQAIESFRREYRALSLVSHPSLLRVQDYGVDEATGRPYIVSDLVPGKPFLEATRGRAEAWIAAALAWLLEALDELHRRGLIHRDIKSSNVLVDENFAADRPATVTLMDFGLVEDLAEPARPVGGTSAYLAPELLLGERASPRSDLFAAGVLAYRALAGRAPWQAHSVAEVLSSLPRPRPVSEFREGVTPSFDRLLMRLIDPDPGQRYADAGAVLADLRAIFGPQVIERGSAPDAEALFVDREQELERLEEWVRPDRAAAARPLCLLTGESGIGKTCLAEVLVGRARRRGVRAVTARCRSEVSSAFDPAVVWLRELFGTSHARLAAAVADVRGRYGATLAALDPALGPASQIDQPVEEKPSPFHLLDSIASALCDLSESSPLLLVLDEFQQADAILVDLIWHLTRRVRRLPLRLLVIRGQLPGPRSDLERFEKGVLAEELGFRIPLGALPREAVQMLAEQRLGRARAALLSEQLWALTGGHPRYLDELLQELAEASFEGPVVPAELLPQSLHEAVRRRLGRLDEQALEALVAVLAAGHPVRREDLEAVLDPWLAERVDELVARGFCRRGPDGAVEEAHVVLRDEALATIAGDARRKWHRRWAEWHASVRTGPVARAAQLIAADAGTAARDELLAAGEHLFDSWQYRAAVRFFSAALERTAIDDPRRLHVLARLSRACRESRDLDQAIDVCAEWARIGREFGDAESEARALGTLASVLRELGRWAPAEKAARDAVALADRLDDVEVRSFAHKVLGTILWERWQHDEAIRHFRRACELSEKLPDSLRHGFNLHDAAVPLALSGRTYEALRINQRASRLLDRLGSIWYRLNESARALVLSHLGESEEGIAGLTRAVEELARLNVFVPLEVALENLLFLQIWNGHYGDALVTGRRVLEEASRANRNELRVVGLLCLGEIHSLLDEREAARDHNRIARDLAMAVGVVRQEMFARLAIARDHREDGRLGEARDEAQRVLEWARGETAPRQRIGAALELARIARIERRADEALEWVDEAAGALGQRSEDHAALAGGICLERALAWEAAGKPRRAGAAAESGLGFVRSRGPVEQEIQLEALRSRTARLEGRNDESERALGNAARRLREVAERIDDPAQRARYVSRPDRAAILNSAQRLRESGAERLGTLRGLIETVHQLAGNPAPEDLVQRIVEIAVREAGAQRGALLLRDAGSGGRLEPVATVGLDTVAGEPSVLRISERVLEGAEAKGAILADEARVAELVSSSPSISTLGIRAVMCVRVENSGQRLGCLYVDARDPHTRFSDLDLDLLRALGELAGMALGRERALSGETPRIDAEIETERFGEMIARSATMHGVFELLERVAASDVPVLIQGESGTGKELAARAIHGHSPRADGPFLSENCAAIPETLLESALFGHVRGAFTGADSDSPGLFERADGGTLFLDEIGEMSPALQAKLLRVLQDGEYRQVGGVEPRRADVRVVAATHRDLAVLISTGAFRQDLYYRLAGMTVQLPALRDRREDIPLLARHILRRLCSDQRRPVPEIAPDVMRALVAFDWPGNVRQLENVVRRLLLMTDGPRITKASLEADPELAPRRSPAPEPSRSPVPSGAEDEKARLERALQETGGRRNDAAALLGISRATFYRRLKKHGLI